MQHHQQQLILIRGLPGTGKTTLAKAMATPLGADHYEADMYFIEDDMYVYDQSRIEDAHAWCLNQTIRALAETRSVIVANTFVKRWTLETYYSAAKLFNCPVIELVCKKTWVSTHGVPQATLEHMVENWEN